jgi:N-acetylglucosamine-6-phosphate deacetylase
MSGEPSLSLRAVRAEDRGETIGRHFATGEPIRLLWEAGRISRIEPLRGAAPETWLAPPLFDLQVNGYGGIDFQQDNLSVDQLLWAVRRLRADGCARFLLTLITDEWPRLMRRLAYLRQLRSQSPELLCAIAGWHIEGPFLSPKPGFHGTHDPALMCDPAPRHIRELRAFTGADPVLLTLAPERAGGIEAVSLATSLGIKVSLGHTDASAEVLERAIQAGAICFTHLGNGCPSELNRHDNILWRVLDTSGLPVSLIPDRIHLSPPFFRLVHRLLGPCICYITDAMAAAGAPPGLYTLGRIELEVGPDQVVRRPGSPLLSGSALRPIDGILRAAQMLGCSWQAVWPGFSEVPARMVGLQCRLAVGQPSDFCVLTPQSLI